MDYKFVVFSLSILQEIAFFNEVTGMFLHEIVMKMNASITNELNIPWNPSISPVFSEEDSTRFAACTFLVYHRLQRICHSLRILLNLHLVVHKGMRDVLSLKPHKRYVISLI